MPKNRGISATRILEIIFLPFIQPLLMTFHFRIHATAGSLSKYFWFLSFGHFSLFSQISLPLFPSHSQSFNKKLCSLEKQSADNGNDITLVFLCQKQEKKKLSLFLNSYFRLRISEGNRPQNSFCSSALLVCWKYHKTPNYALE